MSTMNTQLLDANFGELSRYVVNGTVNEDFLIVCTPNHEFGTGYFCSEPCQIRQQIRLLYQQIVAIYSATVNEVQWRWFTLDKQIIDDQVAVYEKTFKGQLVGVNTTEEVHLALGVLEEKLTSFFHVIYPLISSMADHKNYFGAVRQHLAEANPFFDLYDQAYNLMQEYLSRTVNVTNIDLVMTLKLCFNLKLRLIIPSTIDVKAKACPFLVKSLPRYSSTLSVPGSATQLHVFDHGSVTPDFENFYLKPAAESYDLQMPGMTETAEGNSKRRGAKRTKKVENIDNICMLKRNIRDFVPSNPNSSLNVDFSSIRLEVISKREQDLRKQMAKGSESTPIPIKTAKTPSKETGVVEKGLAKIKRRISGSKNQPQIVAAAVIPILPKIEEPKQLQLVAELLNYIVVTVEIQFSSVSFHIYKKIKVPVAVATHSNQRPGGYGSAIWNLIVWLEEANLHNYQWDWPEPYGRAVQREVIDANYAIDHQYFVDTYLNALITVLSRVNLGEPKPKIGENLADDEEFVDNPMVDTFLSDEHFEDIRDALIASDQLMALNLRCYLPASGAKGTFKHLNAIQIAFLSAKLLNFSTSNYFVTRASFLGNLKDTQKSFFYWFFFTCQAIGKNFGIKPKSSNWFGNPQTSLFHSNFVIGYIDENLADATLKSFEGVNHLLLIRFSGSEKQSVVVHMKSGHYGPVQRSPVTVGVLESLESILRNPLFTPNYNIVTWDSQCQVVLRSIAEFHEWVAQATNSAENLLINSASTPQYDCLSPPPDPDGVKRRYLQTGPIYDQIKGESNLHNLMAELRIQQNAAKNLCDILTEVRLSSEEVDFFDGPETRRKLREILSTNPVLIESQMNINRKCDVRPFTTATAG